MNRNLSLILFALILASCGGSPTPPQITLESDRPDATPTHIQSQHQYNTMPRVQLPITNEWSNWQCNEGSFATRYPDSSKQTLEVRAPTGQETLEIRPGDNPVTYENARIAFYSNGNNAVLARPASATILLSGCHP
ncbi:MAG: hypothetical protein Q4A74_05935 [Cardiobacteriaceae bacterium]|nr:hypothetical protein [Cardiobacteriaceae bacterium]